MDSQESGTALPSPIPVEFYTKGLITNKQLRPIRKASYTQRSKYSSNRDNKTLCTTPSMAMVVEEPQGRTTSSAACNKALRQSVFDVLTCPICHEYMNPPITLCQGGHNVCSRCRPTLQFTGGNKCPRCRRVLLETRNVALETIARGLRYPCRYSSAGCKLKFSMEDIAKHHARCSHRSYDCPLRALENCYWNGRLNEVREHVADKHSAAMLTPSKGRDDEVTWAISNAECYQNSHHVVFSLGQVFVFHKRFDIPQRKMCVAVQQAWESTEDEFVSFRYELQLEKNSGKQTAVLSSQVHDDSEDIDQVFVAGESMRVDFDMLMSFVKGARTMRILAKRKQSIID